MVIFSCFNRKEKTKQCIETLSKMNLKLNFTFVIVDDNSIDGTRELLIQMKQFYNIHTIYSSGNLYYSRSMRVGMEYVLNSFSKQFDYVLLINDDVKFYANSIESLIVQSKIKNDSVIVGTTCDDNGNMSYGAIKYLNKGIKYETLPLEKNGVKADTFNANCVLIPYYIFKKVDIMDHNYIHSLGDFDYGLQIGNRGYNIYPSKNYVGVCNKNPIDNSWSNNKLSIWRRIMLKESPKGLPSKQWFYFLKKNFNINYAVWKSITPYIRIILKK